MQNATHFIEVYNSKPGFVNYSPFTNVTPIFPICKIEHSLDLTNSLSTIHTIAIFKIKPKNNGTKH